jgi:hypothetical protein
MKVGSVRGALVRLLPVAHPVPDPTRGPTTNRKPLPHNTLEKNSRLITGRIARITLRKVNELMLRRHGKKCRPRKL